MFENKTNKTVEQHAATKNSIRRLIFAAIAILLQFFLLLSLFTWLSRYATWINLVLRAFAFLIVLRIYSMHKNSTMKLPWIVLILVFPLMGVLLYLMLGIDGHTRFMRLRYKKIDDYLMPLLSQDDETIKKLEGEDKDLAGVASYIQYSAGFPVYDDSNIRYFSDTNVALESMLKDLSAAKNFIFMEYHAIEDSVCWQKIENVLKERVKNGVEVRVFYDDLGCISFLNVDFTKKLNNLGIQCKVFNPFLPGLNMFLNNRDHRKITVIDGRIAYTGGYNLADEYFNVKHPYGMWKDSGVRITGGAVKSFTVIFLDMWDASPNLGDPIKKFHPPETDLDKYLLSFPSEDPASGFVQPYADNPVDSIQTGEDVYLEIIGKSNHYCYFMTPYLIITDEMARAFSLAAMRGVDVRIVTPGKPDKKLVFEVTRSFYNSLTRNGVRIYEWTPGFCHSKICVSDDRLAVCGSINLDYRSLYHHFEDSCVFYNCDAVLEVKKDFLHTFKECLDVTETYRSGRSASLRLGQMFLRLFAQLL